MKDLPDKPGHRFIPGPRAGKPRLTLDYPLPAGVRRGHLHHGDPYRHLYLQHDGRWAACHNRSACRECRKEETMKTTAQKMREALADHFGPAYLDPLADDAPLFPAVPHPGTGRCLGDDDDRHEVLECLDREFGTFLPEEAISGSPSIATLSELVDVLLAGPACGDR